MIPISAEQIREGWQEIRRQEELQRSLLEVEERRRQAQQSQKKQHASANQAGTDQHASSAGKKSTKSRSSTGAAPKRKGQTPARQGEASHARHIKRASSTEAASI